MERKFKLLGLGSAIVDVLAYTDEEFIEKNNLDKGSMKLVDYETAISLYQKLGVATECSGGSAGNTCSGFAILGGKVAFLGKVKDDYLGRVFKKDIEKVGVSFPLEASKEGRSTSKCVIFVTEEDLPSGRKKVERTMATYLDFDVIISEEDITEEIISSAEMLFFEGYLFDNPKSKKAVQKAIQLAKKLGTKIAFTASDPNCIKRHQADFLEIIRHYADVIFANEAEAEAIFDEKDLRKNLYNFITLNATSCITRGEAGSYIVQDEKIYDIEAVKVNDVYDVTGAGDAYAAGVLYGYLYGLSPEKYGKLGSLSAAEVIKYLGGRPNTDLSQLLNKI